MVCGREHKCRVWLRTLQLTHLWNVNTINEYTCLPPGSVLVCFVILTSFFLLFDRAPDLLSFLLTQDWKQHFAEGFQVVKSTENIPWIPQNVCFTSLPFRSHYAQDCAKCHLHNLAQQIISHEHTTASLKKNTSLLAVKAHIGKI